MPQGTDIRVQLLPRECSLIQKRNGSPAVQLRLDALATDVDVATIKLTQVDLDCLISDMNHAIVKLSCDDEEIFALSDRHRFILETGKAMLKAWH
jgi:hypothetical protein